MSLFSTPTEHVEPPPRSALAVPLLVGAAICLAYAVTGRLDSVMERVPVGLIAGGAYAVGGVAGWFWRRARARARLSSPW